MSSMARTQTNGKARKKEYFENIESAGPFGHKVKSVYSSSCFICSHHVLIDAGACGAGNFELTSPEIKCGTLCEECSTIVLTFMRQQREVKHADDRNHKRNRERKRNGKVTKE